MHAMQEALRLMHEEGPDAVFARHEAIGAQVRDGIARLGLELFPESAVASNTVSAVRVPAGVDASALLRNLRERHGVVLGSGQEWLKGSIFRIGHMGWVQEEDIVHLLDALRQELQAAGRREAV